MKAWTRCDAWMPNARESCARRAGHRDAHRTRWAMDNAYRAATGRDPSRRVNADEYHRQREALGAA